MKCLEPIYLRTTQQTVPCGKCGNCRSRKANDWVIRLTEEFKASRNALFVTLTYDDSTLPYIQDGTELFQTLKKDDLKSFINLLRTYCPFRYYAIGEYGDKGHRPHYHLLLFNFFPVTNPQTGGLVYHKDWNKLTEKMVMSNVDLEAVIFKAWKNGKVDVQNMDGGAIRYLAYYVVDPTVNVEVQAQQKPFALMSTRPPIGANYYLNEDVKKYHRSPTNKYNRMYYQGEFGKSALPRIYKQKMFSKIEIQKANVLYQDKQAAQFKKVENIQKYAKNLYEAAEHKNSKLNQALNSRKL